MLEDWEIWLRLLAVAGMALGAYRTYRLGLRAGQWTAKSFFLIVALGLAYAAGGVGLMLGLAELLGPGHGGTVAVLFFGYMAVGIAAVVWLSIKIARKHGPDRRRPAEPSNASGRP